MPSLFVHVYGVFYVGWTSTIRAAYLECLVDSTYATGSYQLVEQEQHGGLVGVVWDFMCELIIPLGMKSKVVVFSIIKNSPHSSKEEVGKAEININTLETGRWKDTWPSLQGAMLGAQLGLRLLPDGCGAPVNTKYAKVPKYLRIRMAEASREGPFVIPRRQCSGRSDIPVTGIAALAAVAALVAFSIHKVSTIYRHLYTHESDSETEEEVEEKYAMVQHKGPKAPRTADLLKNVELKSKLAKEKAEEDTHTETKLREKVAVLKKRTEDWEYILDGVLKTKDTGVWMLRVQVQCIKDRVQRAVDACRVWEKKKMKTDELLRITPEEQSAIRAFEAAKKQKALKQQQQAVKSEMKALKEIPEHLRRPKQSSRADRSALTSALKQLDKHLEFDLFCDHMLLQQTRKIHQLKAKAALVRRVMIGAHGNELQAMEDKIEGINREIRDTEIEYRDAVAENSRMTEDEHRVLRGVAPDAKKALAAKIKNYLKTVHGVLRNQFDVIVALRNNYTSHSAVAAGLSVLVTTVARRQELVLRFKSFKFLVRRHGMRLKLSPLVVDSVTEYNERIADLFSRLAIPSDPDLVAAAEVKELAKRVLPKHLRHGAETVLAPSLRTVKAVPVYPDTYPENGPESGFRFAHLLKDETRGLMPKTGTHGMLCTTPSSVMQNAVDCVDKETFCEAVGVLVEYVRNQTQIERSIRCCKKTVRAVEKKHEDYRQWRDQDYMKMKELRRAVRDTEVEEGEEAREREMSARRTLKEYQLRAAMEQKMRRLNPMELQVLYNEKSKVRHAIYTRPPPKLRRSHTPPALDDVLEKTLVQYKYLVSLQKLLREGLVTGQERRVAHQKVNKHLFSKECVRIRGLQCLDNIDTPPGTPEELTLEEAQVLAKYFRQHRVPKDYDDNHHVCIVLAACAAVRVVARRGTQSPSVGSLALPAATTPKFETISIPLSSLQTALYLCPAPPASAAPGNGQSPGRPQRPAAYANHFESLRKGLLPSPADAAWREHYAKQAKRKETFMLQVADGGDDPFKVVT